MLVLTMRPGKAVRIGKDVVVRILSRNGNNLRVGIDAPKDTLILRDGLTARDEDAAARTPDDAA